MSLSIQKPGLFTTVQDLGRTGFLHQGVSESGAMDRESLYSANLIVGNQPNEAGLEMTIAGPEIKVEADTLMTVTGGGMQPVVNGENYSLGAPFFAPAGSMLTFQVKSPGCRAYLAVAGGLAVPVVMNSKSTYAGAGIGGFKGRALEKEDRLPIGKKNQVAAERFEIFSNQSGGKPFVERWGANGRLVDGESKRIRAFPGTHFDLFTSESQTEFFQSKYTISTQSDRMGYRLQVEKPLELSESLNLLSEAVAFGTVQVPADGQPIVLMADRQTTGGYLRIAQVAAVDLGRLAQLRPGETVSFEKITLHEAEDLFREQAQAMRARGNGIFLKWKQ